MTLLLLLACHFSGDPQQVPPSPPPLTFSAMDAGALSVAIQSVLEADETLAASPAAGPVGPSADCAVAAVFRGPRREIGLVLVCGDQLARAGALHPWAGDEVGSVFLADADADGHNEVIVLASWMSGVGPEGAIPFQANAVMRWDGHALTHLTEAEARVGALTNEGAVREAL